jgi:hypothetical protein
MKSNLLTKRQSFWLWFGYAVAMSLVNLAIIYFNFHP